MVVVPPRVGPKHGRSLRWLTKGASRGRRKVHQRQGRLRAARSRAADVTDTSGSRTDVADCRPPSRRSDGMEPRGEDAGQGCGRVETSADRTEPRAASCGRTGIVALTSCPASRGPCQLEGRWTGPSAPDGDGVARGRLAPDGVAGAQRPPGRRDGPASACRRPSSRMSYRRNSAARALVTKRSTTIGVIGFDTTLFGPASTLFGVDRQHTRRLLRERGQRQDDAPRDGHGRDRTSCRPVGRGLHRDRSAARSLRAVARCRATCPSSWSRGRAPRGHPS